MEELTGLSRARSDLAEAGERLTRIKEALSGGEPDAIRPKRWRALRRLLEMTREALSSWSAAPRKDEENAALWRESSELQANGLKTENALRTLDRRQRALDDERSSVLAELTRVHEGWRLLRLRWEREGSIPQAKAAELFERWYAVISSACETLEEERQVQSDAREAEQLWRWLLDSGFPALEARLREGDEALLLPALRRLLAEQDRRWTQSRRLWADQVSERSLKAFEELQLKCAQLENELRLTEARACERERALAEEATLAARLSAQAQAERDRALEEPHVLRQRLEGMARELEETRRAQAEAVSATNLWRMLHETARADIGRLMEQLAEEQRKSAESQSELEAAQGRLRALGLYVAQAQTEEAAPAPPAPQPPQPYSLVVPAPPALPPQPPQPSLVVPAPPALPPQPPLISPAPPAEAPPAPLETTPAPLAKPAELETPQPAAAFEAIPSVEAPLEPAWRVVLERLRQPLAAAAAQVRRLHAAPMPADYKSVAQLAARSLAQASDTVKAVREFLEEGRAPAAAGRLDEALDSALSSWEPVLQRHGVRIVRDIAHGLPPVPAASESLRIAIYQFLRNAFEAMPRGGTLSVSARYDESSREVRAVFADTGPGFPKERLERLFVPFDSSKLGHLGLGLALARRIARRAGGELEAGAAAQGGALLTLRLPASPQAERP